MLERITKCTDYDFSTKSWKDFWLSRLALAFVSVCEAAFIVVMVIPVYAIFVALGLGR